MTFDGLQFSRVNRQNPHDSPGPTHDTGATGEIAQQNSKAIVWPSYQPEADGFMRLGDVRGEFSPSQEVDGISNQTAQLRDGAVHRDMPTDTHPNDNLLGYPGAGSEDLTNAGQKVGLDVGPVNQSADIWTNGGASTFNADALLQQPNDVAGLISPDQMRPAAIASPTWQINPNQMLGCSVVSTESSDLEFSPISGEGVFGQRDGLGATASMIVGDNHF